MAVALGLTALALLGKVVGGGLGLLGAGSRSMAIVGVGMAPRGEVGLIVASLGLSLGAIPSEVFSVVVIMSILTTLVVPPILRVLYGDQVSAAAASTEVGDDQAGHLPDMGPRPRAFSEPAA
jgi:Kef-type K+ transport system membrane component KefB